MNTNIEPVEGDYDSQAVTLEDRHGEVREDDLETLDYERNERWAEMAERFEYNPLEA